jgi:protein-arginine kinase activator protein McsA
MKEASFVPEDDDSAGIEGIGAEEEEEEGDLSLPKEAKEPPRKLTKLEQLQKDLDGAIKNEDYEKAARLRDDIKKMSSGSTVN